MLFSRPNEQSSQRRGRLVAASAAALCWAIFIVVLYKCERQSLIVQFWAFWTVQGVGCGKRIEMFPFTVF